MRTPGMAAVVAVAVGCGGSDPAPLVTHTCNDTSVAQCGVYTLPPYWPVDVRAACESNGGSWDVPCPVTGRIGTCTCSGRNGMSVVAYYYEVPWRTVEQAAASCTDLGCAWTVP